MQFNDMLVERGDDMTKGKRFLILMVTDCNMEPGPTRLLIREGLVATLLLYSREFVGMLLPALATRADIL